MSALAAELTAIDLGDQRLNRRARRMLEKFGDKPTVSIPAACGGWGETRAAYRLFDHPEVTAEAVLAPHIACTEERLREHPRVLCVQDTTELDYTKKKGIAGLGPLYYETRRGMTCIRRGPLCRARRRLAGPCPTSRPTPRRWAQAARGHRRRSRAHRDHLRSASLQWPACAYRSPAHQGRADYAQGAVATRPNLARHRRHRLVRHRTTPARRGRPARLDTVDQPPRRDSRAGDRKALLVPLPLADRGVTGPVATACSRSLLKTRPRLCEVRRLNRKVNSSRYDCKWTSNTEPWWVPRIQRFSRLAIRCTPGMAT